MNQVEQIVAEFRAKLANAGSHFFMAYTIVEPVSGEQVVMLTSNSNREGIQAILSAILRPTERALELIEAETCACTRAAVVGNMTEDGINNMLTEGTFKRAAVLFFEQLRPFFTIAGWEKPTPGSNPGDPLTKPV